MFLPFCLCSNLRRPLCLSPGPNRKETLADVPRKSTSNLPVVTTITRRNFKANKHGLGFFPDNAHRWSQRCPMYSPAFVNNHRGKNIQHRVFVNSLYNYDRSKTSKHVLLCVFFSLSFLAALGLVRGFEGNREETRAGGPRKSTNYFSEATTSTAGIGSSFESCSSQHEPTRRSVRTRKNSSRTWWGGFSIHERYTDRLGGVSQ